MEIKYIKSNLQKSYFCLISMFETHRGSLEADTTVKDRQTSFRNVFFSGKQSNSFAAMKLTKEMDNLSQNSKSNIKSYIFEKLQNYTQGTSLHGVKHVTKSDSSIQCR